MQLSSNSRFRLSPARLALAVLALLACSCRLAKTVVEAPGKITHSVLGPHDDSPDRVPVSVVQTQVMRFADSFGGQIAQASQEFAKAAGTPQAQIQALGWSVWQRSGAYMIASGPNPNRNLLDMLVFITLSRTVHEEYWGPQVWHEADEPMLAALRQAEADIWSIADKVLSKRQQERVRTTLTQWREKHPNAVWTASTRIPAFQDLFTGHDTEDTNVFEDFAALLNFDPLAGLEPATREVKQARLLGERTLYYVQHAQLVIPTQLELLALKLTNQPDVQSALESSERISLAADSLAETLKTLPESVRAEREKTVNQIAKELTAQRQGLLADLERASQPTNDILDNARKSMEAATEMSTALQGAVTTLDQFIAGLKADSLSTDSDGSTDGDAPSQPFDVREYGIAAEHIGDAARDLNDVLVSLDQHLPQVQGVLSEVSERSGEVVDHAFWRGLTLGVILIVAGALASLGVRWISSRWPRTTS